MNYSQKIKLLRNTYNLSQKQFADKCGVSKSVIGQWENGRQQPRIFQLAKVANAFGLEWYDLMDDDMKLVGGHKMQRSLKDDLIDTFNELNKDGQEFLVKFAQSLLYNPMYGSGRSTSGLADAMYDGAKDQKALEDMSPEEIRKISDEEKKRR